MADVKYELVDSIKLNDCLYTTADAIREKIKTDDAITFDFANSKGFADAIASIPSGSTEVTIRFYDYDGELIRGYTQEEIREMTELPAPPAHENLTFLGWTKTLDALKSYPYSIGVYAKFKPTDGKTRIWISLNSTNKAPTIRFVQSKSQGLLFDWGDGISERVSGTGNLTKQHTYAGLGSYVITITPDSDCTWTPNWGGGTSNTLFPSYGSIVTKVEFGDNISALGAYAFYNYSNVTSILFPEGITQIPESFCASCGSLQHINFPDSVTSIGQGAFSGCISLKQLDIPDTVSTVYYNAFTDCHGLEKVFIPKYLTDVGRGSVSSSWLRGAKLRSAGRYGSGKDIEYGWEQLPNNAFNYNSYLEDIEFPVDCSVISSYAFSNCVALTSIDIPDSVTAIQGSAFYNCYGLTKIEIPASVTSISTGALNYCSNLEKLVIKAPVTSLPTGTNYWIQGCYKLRTATPLGQGGDIEYAWTTSIPSGAFAGSSIEQIVFPAEISNICGFQNCYYLENVEIPDGVKAINSGCFSGCRNLKSIQIPDSVKEISSNVFFGCTVLKELLLPRVTNINTTAAFQAMIALEHIQIGSVGNGVTASRSDIFSYSYNPNLVIEVYTVSNYVNTTLANIRNGAVNAKIIVKASADTVYNGVAYQAGDIILTSAS